MFIKKMLKVTIILIYILMCLTACGSKNNANKSSTENIRESITQNIQPIYKSSFKLNTVVSVTIYDSDDEDILIGCMEVCDYYENLFSKTIPESDIYHLNQEGYYVVSEDTSELIQKGLFYTKLTQGVFNICIAPLSNLWDFIDIKKVPDENKIKSALTHIDYNNITVNTNTYIFKDKEMGMDLGAIAKGYIADRMKEYLISQGIKSALIDLGGNILLVGAKPDGTDFKIGIQKPFESHNEVIAIMNLKDVSVVSSGIYERYFIENEQIYHHILDTSNGYPCNNELISVTILSKYSVDGDALSTSAFALGLEKGIELINSIPDTYAVFITSDYQLHYSDGFLNNIEFVLD